MSNQKLRHWIYLAIGFVILASIAWWFLSHPSKLTDDYIKNEIYSVHKEAFADVTAYLQKKDIIADITDVPTVDNNFGVPNDDTDACQAYNEGLSELIRTEIAEVIYTGTSVQFYSKNSGGLLNRECVVLVTGEAPPTLKGAPRSDLSGKDWHYYIITEKE